MEQKAINKLDICKKSDLYNIDVEQDNEKITNLKWSKIKEKIEFSDIYFIRTSLSSSEDNL